MKTIIRNEQEIKKDLVEIKQWRANRFSKRQKPEGNARASHNCTSKS